MAKAKRAIGSKVFQYTFAPAVQMWDVDEMFFQAVLAVESLHGQARTRGALSYYMDFVQHTWTIEAKTQIGHDLCKIFSSFVIRQFGKSAVKVRRIKDMPCSATPAEKEVSANGR